LTRRTLTFLFVALASPLYASATRLELTCIGSVSCVVNGTAVLRSVADATIERSVAIVANRATADDLTGEWDVTLRTAGFWMPVQRIRAGDHEPLMLKVWPTGRLRARFRTGETPPKAVSVAVATPPYQRASATIDAGTSFACSELNGQWTCEVPATTLDLAFRTSGWAPAYRWDVAVPSAGISDLGQIALKKGASLLAWLDRDAAAGLSKPARAVLRRETRPGPAITALRLAEPVAEASFTKKGVVQLAPLEAGRYVLETHAPGFATSYVPVEIIEGREATLRHVIELLPAVTVRLKFAPEVSPNGKPWSVELWRPTNYGSGWERTGGGLVSEGGILTAENQAAGVLRLRVKDAAGNVLRNRELTVVPGQLEYPVPLDLMSLHGTVKLGPNPLPGASLFFGGRSGTERVKATSGPDGEFDVDLPRHGKWLVEVSAKAAGVAALADVEVTADREQLEIVLPSTEVSGWVTDAQGNRSGSAEVLAFVLGHALKRTAGPDGSFKFNGLPSGVLQIRAMDFRTGDYSKTVDITLPADGTVRDIALSIGDRSKIAGRVTSGGVPAVGAQVHGYAFVGATAQQERTTTDLEGRFAMKIPAAATVVDLVVGVAGRTLHPFQVSSDRPISVDVAPRGGTLSLRWPAAIRAVRVTFNDTVVIPFPDLLQWAQVNGQRPESGSLVVPAVAPGKYGVCVLMQCAEGTLAMGATLALELKPQ
jgi:hypothetical protein